MIYDKINEGYYKPKKTYPEKPKKPEILKKTADKLTLEEIQQILDWQITYEEQTRFYHDAKRLYQESQKSLMDEFYRDLCEEYGVEHDTKFAMILYGIAWERGHSHGLYDVASVFNDLTPLWDEYDRLRKENDRLYKMCETMATK